MTGLTQEEQRKSSPFTLEAALEEEPDVNDGYINDALPFDKCLKADTQADEEEKKRKLYSQLGTAKATKEQSEKEIKEWLGTDTIIKAIFKTIYETLSEKTRFFKAEMNALFYLHKVTNCVIILL